MMDNDIVMTIVKVVIILIIFSTLAGFSTYFERKILAFMQRRLGPTHVGPFGILQVVADGIKLFSTNSSIFCVECLYKKYPKFDWDVF